MISEKDKSLKDVLVYIKDKFGIEIFAKRERVIALLSDLAPSLKSEKNMLQKMTKNGILEEFVSAYNADEDTKKRIVSKAIMILTSDEYIKSNIATEYICIMLEVFGWDIQIDIPKESTIENMKFDVRRFLEESKEADYIKAMKAYAKEDFANARLYFANSYRRGNILAGIKLGQMDYWGEAGEKNYKSALKIFMEGADYGYPLATEWLVEAYRLGKGIPKDRDKAKELARYCRAELEEMCVCGDVDAQYMYAWNLLYGIFCENEEEKGFYWMHRASEEEHLKAKVELAECYLDGRGCVQDIKKGLCMMKQLVTTSSIKAHYRLGKMYLYGEHVEEDDKKAFSLLKFAAEREHVTAMRYMGNIYCYGHGVEKDYAEARKWYEKSAAAGNGAANEQLGWIYFAGKGVPEDEEKAFRYFKIAADKGYEFSQYEVAIHYICEEKYKDYEMGMKYLEKSAEQGFVEAQKLLARMYVSNYGFDDDSKFVYWLRKAAEQGDAEAQRRLGESYYMFWNEDILPKSYQDAVLWLEKAVEGGDIEAMISLARIYGEGVGIEKNIEKVNELLENAERRILELEKEGEELGKIHNLVADVYYDVFSEIGKLEKAFEHYCKAFKVGDRKVLYHLGWMYFVDGFTSNILDITTEKLLDIIKENEEEDESSNLAFLLGTIYSKGYKIPYEIKVKKDYKEAEKWYLRAEKKGSISALCKLAYIYINEWHKNEDGFDILQKAYKVESVEGTRLLAQCYKLGIGTKKNRSKAKSLFKEAADKGDEEAVEELKKFWF